MIGIFFYILGLLGLADVVVESCTLMSWFVSACPSNDWWGWFGDSSSFVNVVYSLFLAGGNGFFL